MASCSAKLKGMVESFFEEKEQHGDSEFCTYLMKFSKYIRLFGFLTIIEKSSDIRVFKRILPQALLALPITLVMIIAKIHFAYALTSFYSNISYQSMFIYWHISAEFGTLILFMVIIGSCLFNSSTILELMNQWNDLEKQIGTSNNQQQHRKVFTITFVILIIQLFTGCLSEFVLFGLNSNSVTVLTGISQSTCLFWKLAIKLSVSLISVFNVYIPVFYLFLVFALRCLIQDFHLHLENVLEFSHTQSNLKKVRLLYFALYKTARKVKEIVTFPLAAKLLADIPSIILLCYGMIKITPVFSLGFFCMLSILLAQLMFLISLCEGGHRLQYHTQNTKEILYSNLQISDEIRTFVIQAKMFPIDLSLGDFICMNRNCLIAVIGSIVTYFIVILQMSPY